MAIGSDVVAIMTAKWELGSIYLILRKPPVVAKISLTQRSEYPPDELLHRPFVLSLAYLKNIRGPQRWLIGQIRPRERRGEWEREFKIVNWHSEIASENRPFQPTDDRASIEATGFSRLILTDIQASEAVWLQSAGPRGIVHSRGGTWS
ncbi:MAG: hypothetical protein O9293_09550 [Porphyrobacter sp.]|nr:hypothetical protein [Porphyrobacter sp.]